MLYFCGGNTSHRNILKAIANMDVVLISEEGNKKSYPGLDKEKSIYLR